MNRHRISSEKQTGIVLFVFALVGISVFPISSWFSSKLFPSEAEPYKVLVSTGSGPATLSVNHGRKTTAVIDEPEAKNALIFTESETEGELVDDLLDIETKYAIEYSFVLTAASAHIFSSTSDTFAQGPEVHIPVYYPDASESGNVPPVLPSLLGVIDSDEQPEMLESTSGTYQVVVAEPTKGVVRLDKEQELEITVAAQKTNPPFSMSEHMSMGVLQAQGIVLPLSYKVLKNIFNSMDAYVRMSGDSLKMVLTIEMFSNLAKVSRSGTSAPLETASYAPSSLSNTVPPHRQMATPSINQSETRNTAQSANVEPPVEIVKPMIRPRARPTATFITSKPVERTPMVGSLPTETSADAALTDMSEMKAIGVKVIGLFKLPNASWMLVERRDGTIVKLLKGSQFNGMRVLEIESNFAVLQAGSRKITVRIGTML